MEGKKKKDGTSEKSEKDGPEAEGLQVGIRYATSLPVI